MAAAGEEETSGAGSMRVAAAAINRIVAMTPMAIAGGSWTAEATVATGKGCVILLSLVGVCHFVNFALHGRVVCAILSSYSLSLLSLCVVSDS